MIAGDVAYETSDVGVALDQLAREILRHLTQHKLTVVWLFDESGSMKDDQKAIRQKFDRVASELKLHTETGPGKNKKSSDALNHAIVGFGKGLHYELEKPTFDIDEIGRAIDHLRIDDTGVENTMGAIQEVIGHYASLIRKDRRLLLVLVTDESGDDGGKIEEARQAAVSRGVPIYVIGRQSLFGYERAHLRYIDPVTKDDYWPTDPPRPRDGRHRDAPVGRAARTLGRAALGVRPLRAGPPGQGHRRHLFPAPQRGEPAAPQQGEGVLDRDAEGVPARLREPRELLREAGTGRSSAGPCTRSSSTTKPFPFRTTSRSTPRR